MKNIYLIPTKTLNALYYDGTTYKEHNSTMAMKWYRDSSGYKPQNIYITSDEEIKIGDWVYSIRGFIGKVAELETSYTNRYKKIILTTNKKLIKKGIQAINDDFIQWFIKNPTCEFVEIEEIRCLICEANYDICPTSQRCSQNKYNIIIPKEEPKQETFEENANDFITKYNKVDIKEAFMTGVCGFPEPANFTFLKLAKKLGEKQFEEWFKQFEIKKKNEFTKELPEDFFDDKLKAAEEYADIHMKKFDLTNVTHLPFQYNDRDKIEKSFKAGVKWLINTLLKT